jgi:2-hydroxychromene-2-carboxylate isomerase
LPGARWRPIAFGIGVPTVAIGDELFWGDDQLEAAAATT